MVETPLQYEIRIQGHLAPRRLRRFEGLTIRHDTGGETVIVARFRDQAALYGLLSWFQRLGVTLLLVRRVKEPPADREDAAGRRAGVV
ncbi:MAG: hypothetical protein P8189_10610 [Anaerolineae bacterium]|jgi:hypothetical protein